MWLVGGAAAGPSVGRRSKPVLLSSMSGANTVHHTSMHGMQVHRASSNPAKGASRLSVPVALARCLLLRLPGLLLGRQHLQRQLAQLVAADQDLDLVRPE